MRYYGTADKPRKTRHFFIQTSTSEYGIKIFHCEIIKVFHRNDIQHSQHLVSSFILSIHNRKPNNFITNFNDQCFKYHVTPSLTEEKKSLYLTVISPQHKINYTLYQENISFKAIQSSKLSIVYK